jgi:hypothetical protein
MSFACTFFLLKCYSYVSTVTVWHLSLEQSNNWVNVFPMSQGMTCVLFYKKMSRIETNKLYLLSDCLHDYSTVLWLGCNYSSTYRSIIVTKLQVQLCISSSQQWVRQILHFPFHRWKYVK